MSIRGLLDAKCKLWSHVIELFFVVIVIALTGAQMSQGPIFTRAEPMSIAMGAKTIIVIGYQLLASHVERCQKWKSYTAYMILNCLEIVFWVTVLGLKVQGMQTFCEGTACSLSGAALSFVVLIVILAVHVATISVLDWRFYKKNQTSRSTKTYTYEGTA